jgi:hypothetical protein
MQKDNPPSKEDLQKELEETGPEDFKEKYGFDDDTPPQPVRPEN